MYYINKKYKGDLIEYMELAEAKCFIQSDVQIRFSGPKYFFTKHGLQMELLKEFLRLFQ